MPTTVKFSRSGVPRKPQVLLSTWWTASTGLLVVKDSIFAIPILWGAFVLSTVRTKVNSCVAGVELNVFSSKSFIMGLADASSRSRNSQLCLCVCVVRVPVRARVCVHGCACARLSAMRYLRHAQFLNLPSPSYGERGRCLRADRRSNLANIQ